MSWSKGLVAFGHKIAAEVHGIFDREIEQPWHNETSRLMLEAHKTLIHIFGTKHATTPISVSSYGHFNDNGTGESHLKLSMTDVSDLPQASPDDETEEERVNRLLDEAHQTQRALTDAHAPSVIPGVTTPTTPDKEPENGEAQGNEEGNEEGQGLLVLREGAGLLPVTEPTDAEGSETGGDVMLDRVRSFMVDC